MKRFHVLMLSGMLSAATGGAVADSGSLNAFTPEVLPVLVRVDSRGKVTDVSPAYELPPRFSRLLARNLGEMIAKPAYDHDRPVASQLVINLALQTTPREEGDYDAHFAYVSSQPVPIGSWYWVHEDGHRLALANRNDIRRIENLRFNRHRPEYLPQRTPDIQSAPGPAIRSAASNVTSPAAPRDPGRGR